MRRRSRHQLVLDLDRGRRTLPPSAAPEALLTADAETAPATAEGETPATEPTAPAMASSAESATAPVQAGEPTEMKNPS